MPGYERTPFFAFQSIFKEQPAVAAFIRTATAQNIPKTTWTQLTFATPIIEDPLNTHPYQSLWDSGTPGQFTISIRGIYLIGGALILDVSASGRAGLAINVNGITVTTEEVSHAGGANFTVVGVSTMYPCVAGDVVTLWAYQDSAGTIATVPAGKHPNFWIVRVG